MSAFGVAAALVAVGLGALIQRSIGFGFSLVAVPTLALLRPDAVPVTLLLLALPMTTSMAFRGRSSINAAAFAWITGGRALGTLAGAVLLAAVSDNLLARLLGFLIVAAALMSFIGPAFKVRNSTQLLGGIVSGVMSTAAALGGPPLALVNQRSPGPELRSTLAISFVAGLLMSLVVLALAGRVEGWHALLALKLLPGLLVGLWIGGRAVSLLDERWLRPAVLAFAAVSGLLVLILGPSS